MPGGLLNIIAQGNNNVILTGNPSKTFFKVAYAKYSNFGLQKFRLDYDGLRDLRLTEPSTFQFKVKRYAELLMDTYLVVTLPDIWSPVYPPLAVIGESQPSITQTDPITGTTQTLNPNKYWVPYDFQWIEDIGTNIISEITITCGALTIQKYTGEYLAAMVDRDFSTTKKELFNKMTGNVRELYDPANSYGRQNNYPSASYTSNSAGAEPSIRGRTLYIPINTWFTLNSNCAFPLIALQYNELVINVTLRPIQDLFRVRDVTDYTYSYPYVQPDFTLPKFQMYRFLQTPPHPYIRTSDYSNKTTTWNADVHLLSTYCFLSKEETKLFATEDQVYLVKDVFTYNFENCTGSKKVKLDSNGMIANWMWFFRRNDVNLRNQWSNYTNWPYTALPSNVVLAPSKPTWLSLDSLFPNGTIRITNGLGVNYDTNSYSGITITDDFNPENEKNIMTTMGILLNGEYRENTWNSEIYNYVEKYVRTQGSAKDGLYCYNFCLNTSPFEYQPSGAMNLSKFKDIQLEFTTIIPTINTANIELTNIYDNTGQCNDVNIIGVRKSSWRLYDYNFDLTVFEERYNILTFIGGNCGMLYSR